MRLDKEDIYNILLLMNTLISGVLLFWRLSGIMKKVEKGLKE